LHSTVIAQVQDHEQRIRAIEHCDVDQVPALGDRVRNLEDWALVVKTKSAIYGAGGAFLGGFAFQLLLKYVLNW
jgi:hypothetical protein